LTLLAIETHFASRFFDRLLPFCSGMSFTLLAGQEDAEDGVEKTHRRRWLFGISGIVIQVVTQVLLIMLEDGFLRLREVGARSLREIRFRLCINEYL